jgi:ribosome maturation factor RimP|tara:strand:- start:694 stop:1227 length:534 start_codon:yes stop_codon:yes gene_type:complete
MYIFAEIIELIKDKRRLLVPFFFDMNFRSQVETLLQAALEEDKALFLIDLKIGSDNSINITLDGDQGVTLKDCMSVSRAIEHNIDREEHDFSLEVASAGVGSPLQNNRQYIKNKGRKLRIELAGESIIEGTLSDVDEKVFTLTWKQREPKPVGKGKVTVTKNKILSYDEVISAKVIV